MFILQLIGALIPFCFLAAFIYGAMQLFRVVEGETIVAPKRLGWGLAIGVIGLNAFGWGTDDATIGTGLFIASLIAAVCVCMPRVDRSPSVMTIACIGIFTSICIGVTGNGFVQSVNALVGLVSLFAVLLIRNTTQLHWRSVWIVKTFWHQIWRTIRHGRLLAKGLFSRDHSKHQKVRTAVKTTVITVLIVLFFAKLLSEADAVFAHYVQTLVDELFERTLVSLFFVGVLTWLLTICYDSPAPTQTEIRFIGYIETIVPLSALVVLFGAFIAIQCKYLFGSHVDFQGLDITYSEYVRDGFIELLWAAFFASIVVYITTLKQRTLTDARQGRVVQVANILLLVCLIFLLFSALKRDWMYIEMYGLTRVRIIGEYFLGWLAVMIASLFVFAACKKMTEGHLLGTAGIAGTVVVALLNVCNMDMKIANATPPRGEEKDLFYLASLSSDAVEAWEEVVLLSRDRYQKMYRLRQLSDAQKVQLAEAKIALHRIDEHIRDANKKRQWSYELSDYEYLDRTWNDQNISQKKANARVQNPDSPIHKYLTCLLREIDHYQMQYSVDLYDQEKHRMHNYKYPFINTRSSYYPMQLQWIIDKHGSKDGVRADAC